MRALRDRCDGRPVALDPAAQQWAIEDVLEVIEARARDLREIAEEEDEDGARDAFEGLLHALKGIAFFIHDAGTAAAYLYPGGLFSQRLRREAE